MKKTSPPNVHARAQMGDVKGLRNLVQDNPGLINLRNPIVLFIIIVSLFISSSRSSLEWALAHRIIHEQPLSLLTNMAQTPLHIAVANNKLEAVRFLLQWPGPERPDIEASNVFGETPLHLGAKNGCPEVVKLLLDHKACKEARDNNGMTPLHLAVWLSVRTQNLATVEVLLEYHSDVNAKDNVSISGDFSGSGPDSCSLEPCNAVKETERRYLCYLTPAAPSSLQKAAKVPLDYLSETHKSESLRSLLSTCKSMVYNHRVENLFEESKKRWDDLELELRNIVGLEDLKFHIRKWAKGMLLDEKRRIFGLKVSPRKPPHMLFLGNPGTGKTMVARILSKLLKMVGILAEDKVVEVQRTDLVGEFVGHTGPKTRRKIKEAEGGVLFVDEAYRLIPVQRADDKDYGLEALEEIMAVMDSGRIVVIFAGYTEPMKRVLYCNEGFRRRVTRHFYFHDLNTHEIAEIVHLKIKIARDDNLLHGFTLHSACTIDAIAALLNRETTPQQRKQLNGALAIPLLENAREHLDHRLDLDCSDSQKLVTLTLEDLAAGLALIPGKNEFVTNFEVSC